MINEAINFNIIYFLLFQAFINNVGLLDEVINLILLWSSFVLLSHARDEQL